MLKCSQKDNKKYTFGLRKEQIEEPKEELAVCQVCGREFRGRGLPVCPICATKALV